MGIKYGTGEEDKMTTNQVRLMNGVLLGNGHIDKYHRRFMVLSSDEKYIRWLAEEFSNIGGRMVNHEDRYKFQTGKYDWVKKWRGRWYYLNRKVIPQNISLTPEMAGLWYYTRGSTHDRYGRVTLDMTGMEDSMKNALSLLDAAGYDAFESFNTIQMIESVSNDFLEWMEEPPIGI